ncbi:MAG TPA: lipocalin-like domain-containing protein [Thermoanaerobaculia bacterium]|jgi:predicted secreted hydrolase|nr:lipocalin-like domain-containing protein [Thermoanaerobaculia bacterium]
MRKTFLFLALALLACREPERLPNASISVASALRTANDQGYAKAFEPRLFHFPQDHGPHPDFRTEWWYYTGNLATRQGRQFGFQLTFFRSALAPQMAPRSSEWASRQAYLAHFTITDVEAQRFHFFERWNRGALGLAGARGNPFRVWLEDWSAEMSGGVGQAMHLRASENDAGIDLVLQPGKPPTLQGDRGLSQKNPEPGNASYYYSLTRMPAAGTIRLNDEQFQVTGLAWMDREWSTSALGKNQVGWDWFAIHLADGRDLMLYQLRRKDGSVDPSSNGTVIGVRGETRHLNRSDFQLQVLDHWQSPRSGATYPAGWRLRIPSEQIDVRIEPLLADQELDVSFRYWEGATRIEGTSLGKPVQGRGYVEMTGYTELAPR